METQVGSKIGELLKLKGKVRLSVKNELTLALMNLDPEFAPGVRFKFLEVKKKDEEMGSWIEYNLLLEIDKYQDSVEYLSYMFKNLGKVIKSYSNLEIESIGLSEVECSLPNYYYVLIYILSNGKDKEFKIEEDYFESGGGEVLYESDIRRESGSKELLGLE